MELVVISLIVLFVAFIFSTIGLGGSLVYVPLFFWMGIELTIAIPTALLLNFITAGSASLTYYNNKMIAMRFASPLIITSVLCAPVGAYVTQLLNESTILAMFSIVLTLGGIRMLLPIEPILKVLPSPRKTALIGIIAGIVIGFAAGMLGIGGGVFAVPLFLLLGFETKKAAATSAVFVMFTSVSGLLGHIGVGTINLQIMLFSGISAFVGAQIGSHLMVHYIGSKTIQKIFGIVLLIMAANIIYSLV
jgi:uncharacterized membrane protein YfcA